MATNPNDSFMQLNALTIALRELVQSADVKNVDVDGVLRPTMAKVYAEFRDSANVYETIEQGLASTSATGVENRFFTVAAVDGRKGVRYMNVDGTALKIGREIDESDLISIGALVDYNASTRAFSDPEDQMVSVSIDESRQIVSGVTRAGQEFSLSAATVRAFSDPGDPSSIEVDQGGVTLRSIDQYGRMAGDGSLPGLAFSDPGDPVHVLLDKTGRIAFGLKADGSTSKAGDSSSTANETADGPLPILSQGALDIYGPQIVRAEQSRTYVAVFPRNGRSVRAITADPSLTDSGIVTVNSATGRAIPDDPGVIRIYIVYGQSLSVGAHGLPLVDTENLYPDNVLMFAGPADADIRMGLATQVDPPEVLGPGSLTGFRALTAEKGMGSGDRGETIGEASGMALGAKIAEAAAGTKLLYFAPGLGGTPYSGLKKGTQPYANLMTAVARARDLAADIGCTVVVDAVLMAHGEADARNDGYFDDLIEWQGDIESDVRSVTDQSVGVPFLMNVPSSFSRDESGQEGVNAIIRAHVESAAHYVVTPNYPFPYHTDFLHLSGPGYHAAGLIFADTVQDAIWSRKGWQPVMAQAAVLDGQTITLSFSLPTPPMVIDTDLVAATDGYGFQIYADGSEIEVTDVVIVDDQAGEVSLSLPVAPDASAVLSVHIGMNGHSGARAEANIPRTNLRDSAGDARRSRYDNSPIHNWAMHQVINVTR